MTQTEAAAINRFIGQRIRQCRRALGVTLQTLARELGISYQQLQKYETGRNRISAATLIQVARTLDVPVECMMDPRMLVRKDDRSLDLLERFNAIASETLRLHLFHSAEVYAKVGEAGAG